MFPKIFSWAALCLSLSSIVLAAPIQKRAPRIAMHLDFPDPSMVQADDGTWYAFGTNGNGKRIQVAKSTDFQSWQLLDKEVLPTLAPWETQVDHWAPDVNRRVSYFLSKQQVLEKIRADRNRMTENTSYTTPEKPRQRSGTTALVLPFHKAPIPQAHTFPKTNRSPAVWTKVDR